MPSTTTTPAEPASRARDLLATAGRLVLTWVVLVAVVLGVGWLLTHTLASSVGGWDDDVSRGIADERTPGLGEVADVGTLLADTPVGMAVAALSALAFAAWRRTWRPLVFVALVVAGTGGIYAVGTHLISRDRPPVRILDPGLVPDHSFPSGHVGTAVTAYGALALLALAYSTAARPWALAILLVPVLVLAARLYQGAHHVTDVVTSVGYAGTWLLVVGRAVLPAPVGRTAVAGATDPSLGAGRHV